MADASRGTAAMSGAARTRSGGFPWEPSHTGRNLGVGGATHGYARRAANDRGSGAMMSEKRACKELNARAEPCGAPPLQPGTVIEGVAASGGDCRQHDLDLPDSPRIGGATPGAGRKPKPRVVDIIRESIEERSGEVLDALRAALKADRALVRRQRTGGTSSWCPITRTRIVAARELLDRTYGRSRQASEVTVITEDMIDQAIRRMEEELPSLKTLRGDSSPRSGDRLTRKGRRLEQPAGGVASARARKVHRREGGPG